MRARPGPGGRKSLPRFVAKLVEACPNHGHGVHSWLFKCACRLHPYRSPEEIRCILSKASAGCGREVPAREIEDAVCNSSKSTRKSGRSKRGRSAQRGSSSYKFAEVDPINRQKVIEETPFSLTDFQTISPTRIDGDNPGAGWFIDQLFPGDPLLCVGRSHSRFETNQKTFLADRISEYSQIVPSAMTSVWGTTKDSRPSMHALSNTGQRMYLVVEFDHGTPDEQASVLNHLGDFAPLAMVLWSGGKSTHGWFNCQGTTEQQQRAFFNYAFTLGADSRMWSRCQFARLPQGWRSDKQARQQVHFFNPQNAWKGPAL